jgi:hypothetical protein
LDREKLRRFHDGEGEAVSAVSAESTRTQPRKKRAPVSCGGRDKGVSGTISTQLDTAKSDVVLARTIRQSDAERRETLSSPARWVVLPVECTPDEESVTMNREQAGYGCSSTVLWEAENDRTHLDPVP